ncbi:MAG: co-chaperone GroES [Christensenellales bacterium]
MKSANKVRKASKEVYQNELETPFDRVVLKDAEIEETTRAVLSSRPPRRKPQYAYIVAVGPRRCGWQGSRHAGEGRPEGRLFKYAGTEIKIDGEEYKIVRQNDILAIVEG